MFFCFFLSLMSPKIINSNSKKNDIRSFCHCKSLQVWMSLYAYKAAVVAADIFFTGALGNLWKFVSATFWTTFRYKRSNTVLGFGCKKHCLCKTMFIKDITTLQAAMKAVYTIFTVIFIHKVYVIVISLQVMSGQLCQTQTSVCSLFVSTDLIVIRTVVLSSWHCQQCLSPLNFLLLMLFCVCIH